MSVKVLDVTSADAASRVVGEQVVEGFESAANSGQAVGFRVIANVDDDRNRYIVSVHVDATGDGTMSSGDFLTTQSYPVLTLGYPDRVDVELTQV
ncbi:MAG: hypothetical protein JWL61_5573 [Gemmatimonadetes bacterium]|jgi:hypothetical protein|nr:hypothetical protein [Gemmatimonadota bacterium]